MKDAPGRFAVSPIKHGDETETDDANNKDWVDRISRDAWIEEAVFVIHDLHAE